MLVAAFPLRAAAIVAGSFSVALLLPSMLTALPVFVPLLSAMDMERAVPQLAVVMLPLPLKFVPLMVRAVCNVVAVLALP